MTAVPEVWLLPTGLVAIRVGEDDYRVIEPGDDVDYYLYFLSELPADAVRLVPERDGKVVELTITRAVLAQQTRKRDEALAERDAAVAAVRGLVDNYAAHDQQAFEAAHEAAIAVLAGGSAPPFTPALRLGWLSIVRSYLEENGVDAQPLLVHLGVSGELAAGGSAPHQGATTDVTALQQAVHEIAAEATASGLLQPGAAFALGCLGEAAGVGPGWTSDDVARALTSGSRATTDVTALLAELDRIAADPHRAWLYADQVRALLGATPTTSPEATDA